MDNNNELQEFDLDDILNEFHEDSEEAAQEPVEAEEESSPAPLSQDTLARLESLIGEEPEATEASEEPAPQLGDTIRMGDVIREVRATEEPGEDAQEEPAISEDATIRIEIPDVEEIATEESAVDPK